MSSDDEYFRGAVLHIVQADHTVLLGDEMMKTLAVNWNSIICGSGWPLAVQFLPFVVGCRDAEFQDHFPLTGC